MLDQYPDAAVALTRAMIQACRYIVQNKSGTVDVMLKYAPGMNRAVLDRAYDELLRIKGFEFNGDMTEANMRGAHDRALLNHQIDRPVPISDWADFRFRERALVELGRFTG